MKKKHTHIIVSQVILRETLHIENAFNENIVWMTKKEQPFFFNYDNSSKMLFILL